ICLSSTALTSVSEGSSAVPAPDPAALELDGLARRLGSRWVLRGISPRQEPGTRPALDARDGSGQTTLLRLITTAIRPTRGTGRVFGQDLVRAAAAARAAVGILAHHAGLYEDLTAGENLAFALRMYGRRADPEVIDAVLDEVGLDGE